MKVDLDSSVCETRACIVWPDAKIHLESNKPYKAFANFAPRHLKSPPFKKPPAAARPFSPHRAQAHRPETALASEKGNPKAKTSRPAKRRVGSLRPFSLHSPAAGNRLVTAAKVVGRQAPKFQG